jgi:hypothetical protein
MKFWPYLKHIGDRKNSQDVTVSTNHSLQHLKILKNNQMIK